MPIGIVGLPKVGSAKPVGTRAAKRAKPVVPVGSWGGRWDVVGTGDSLSVRIGGRRAA